MDRRKFLKNAGLGSAALAALPSIGSMLSTPAWALGTDDDGYLFVVVSKLTTGSDLLAISGCGNIIGSEVTGGGSWVHFVPEGDPPFPIEATGTWTADELRRYETIGNYGSLTAGTMKVRASFILEDGSVIPGGLEQACNLAPGNLFTGKEEGVTVRADGNEFVPQDPPVGLTVFTQALLSP